MTRHILDESSIHEAIRDIINTNHRDIVEEVQEAIKNNTVVVVGMSQNPHCKRACKMLNQAKVTYKYLEFGSYLKEWRRRNALKMWTGWPTFPMVFIKGQFIGGANELHRLMKSKEYDQLITA